MLYSERNAYKAFSLLFIFLVTNISYSYHTDDNLAIISSNNQALDLFFGDSLTSQPLDSNRGLYTQSATKEWTILVYMAADNDLRHFAARNINQMAAIGSNQNLNIIVHLDIKTAGNKKITRRYYIEKNKIFHTNVDDPETQCMDSGNPITLYSSCKWMVDEFPAHHYGLVLWNHGTGACDPSIGRILNPSEFFVFNPLTNRLDLDRSIEFLDRIDPAIRGVCWDDSTGNYLTNPLLEKILDKIYIEILNKKRFSVVVFDACLMSMQEIVYIVEPYADFMAASQEVELGTGLNYELVLAPFEREVLSPSDFTKHIAHSFYDTYQNITNDFCYSALDLSKTAALSKNIDTISLVLRNCITRQRDNSVINVLRTSRSKLTCTHFNEPTYLDLHHLYSNIQSNIRYFKFLDEREGAQLSESLFSLLEEGKYLMKQAVIANVTGKNLSRAQGISIYFPEKKMHPSYPYSPFAQHNNWANFLNHYLSMQ